MPEITLETGDWILHGIDLIDYSRPGFVGSMPPSVKALAREFSEVFPYCFILRNYSSHQIAACFSMWQYSDASGKMQTIGNGRINISTFGAPDAIPAGGSRLMTPVLPAECTCSLLPATLSAIRFSVLSRFSGQRSVTMSLDAAILDDGTLLGPDTRRAGQRIQARVAARHDLAANLLKAIEEGAGVSELASRLDQIATAPPPDKHGGPAAQAAYRSNYWSARRGQAFGYSHILATRGSETLLRALRRSAEGLPEIHR
ncbi:MAG TPA: hypothetical protein VG675_21910 [Bryobacteraceae bacterium]|nr:hypothetical protein [Bryobacteraceae bacterium]